MDNTNVDVAYFSMEIGVHPDVPTYAGGLGMLAGDTIRAAADLHVPMIGISLLYREGHFYQRIDESGWQTEDPVHWPINDYLRRIDAQCEINLEGRTVRIGAWQYDVTGIDGFVVPVLLLDTDLPENSDFDKSLTNTLYGGDSRYRLCQEAVLGIGGVRLLRAIGIVDVPRYHMNEGHAGLLTLELLREQTERSPEASFQDQLDAVRHRCVFTTHTPVAAGHDQFDLDMAHAILDGNGICEFSDSMCHDNRLNMTYLGLALTHYVNGVAKRHGDISRHMYAEYKIDSITNGVHPASWVAEPFAELFDRHIAGWKQDYFSLRYALGIPDDEVWAAHIKAKEALIEFVNREANVGMDADVLTIGFARRAAAYKRADLLFDDVERLRHIARESGKIQLVFAGKAHPRDTDGKRMLQRVIELGHSLTPDASFAFLPNYDMNLARLMTSGTDVWLNTPQPPMEASGTSGMKAAVNGVPSLSILDGWWIEGCIEGTTGWAIGTDGQAAQRETDRAADSGALYDKLQGSVMPLYYGNRQRWIEIMRHAIALNGSFFNTQRMLQQYVLRAYYE